MQSQAKHALVTQERDLNTYAELWNASECGPLRRFGRHFYGPSVC